jgi:hypothetical protein
LESKIKQQDFKLEQVTRDKLQPRTPRDIQGLKTLRDRMSNLLVSLVMRLEERRNMKKGEPTEVLQTTGKLVRAVSRPSAC